MVTQGPSIWIIVTSDTIWHEGDQRSRDYPGHGYPAYSEEVDRIQKFTEHKEFTKKLEEHIIGKKKFSCYEAVALVPKLNTSIVFT